MPLEWTQPLRLDWLFFLHCLAVMGIAMVPVLELKAAIPVGMYFGLPLWLSFLLALIGSCIPAPFIIYFLKPLMARFRNSKWISARLQQFVDRARRKSLKIRKYSLFGLFIFVAIPIPGTGVWSGSAIASVLDLRIRRATPIIWLGNVVAGLLILNLSYHVQNIAALIN